MPLSMIRSLCRAAVILGALALAAPAPAAEAWLTPTPTLSVAGAPWTLGAFVGTGFRGTAQPYAKAGAVRFEMRDRPGQTQSKSTQLGGLAREGDTTWVAATFVDERGAMIVYESRFKTRTVPGREFDTYLKSEGLEQVRRSRAAAITTDAPARERWRRVCKTWIGGTKPEKSRATTPFFTALEIVPEDVPGASEKLTFVVLDHGRQLPGALVRVWRQAPGATTDSVGVALQIRTDKKGRAYIALPAPGTWMLSTVHSVAANSPEADWETTFASLTFVR